MHCSKLMVDILLLLLLLSHNYLSAVTPVTKYNVKLGVK
jgi:hypothetical protein